MNANPFVKALLCALVVGAVGVGCSDTSAGDAGARGDVVIDGQNPGDAAVPDVAQITDAGVPLGFFPAQARWAWYFPFRCRREVIATAKTDECGNRQSEQ